METERLAGRLHDLVAASALIGRGAPVKATLAEWAPYLLPQIVADRATGEFERWAHSTVLDENTETPVVSRELFETLHSEAGLPSSWPVGNAGLLHVYGYLLSNVPTPYGYKRDRWIDGRMAAVLGMNPTYFLPWATEPGTLLKRVTDAVFPILTEHHPRPITVARFDDVVDQESGRFFRTAIVNDRNNEQSALIYGVGHGAALKVVTVFPVSEPTTVWLEALRSEPPRPRYNVSSGAE
ncbi:amino acid deaminase [Cryobacterium sp. Y29]|uniref:amino acid deaminase n=1 Tax=Cryobacterium sp. Y29 TaxID=2048285 RepID=UPI0011B0B1FE|nr:amino acid deaminase [Cryobacterium sp. Y29]